MIDFKQIIENDDLDTFKLHFKVENWKDPITKIKNYAKLDKFMAKYIKEVTYDDADCIKYALHCNADKIFNYLLPLVDTDKHGDNYGWPLLAMAVENQRYDYAHAIVNHSNFNPYPRYHTNTFSYIDSRPNQEAHIELLFDYLDKFERWAFTTGSLTYEFTHLICYSEETFNRFEKVYRQKTRENHASLMEIFKDKMELLGEEIFCRKYNEFMINKLTIEDITAIVECGLKNDVFFVQLFEGSHAKEGLTHLLKSPELLVKMFEKNPILLSYLSLENMLLMIDNGVDIWKETENKYNKDRPINTLDFILNNDNVEEEATVYFINKYPKEILNRCQNRGTRTNIQKACEEKLLQNELGVNSSKKKANKI
jgi:hypothetical protein